MSKFALLFAAAMTVAGAGSLVAKTKFAPATVDRADDVSGISTLMAPLLFSVTGLTLSLIVIAACDCDLSALAAY